MNPRLSRRLAVVAGLAGILAASGCSKEEVTYVPSPELAKGALEAAMNAWQGGLPYGTVTAGKPITLVDSRWQSGQALERFETLEELPPNPHRAIRVRMKLVKQKSDEEVTYLVIGLDPVLIYRAEDFERERSAY